MSRRLNPSIALSDFIALATHLTPPNACQVHWGPQECADRLNSVESRSSAADIQRAFHSLVHTSLATDVGLVAVLEIFAERIGGGRAKVTPDEVRERCRGDRRNPQPS